MSSQHHRLGFFPRNCKIPTSVFEAQIQTNRVSYETNEIKQQNNLKFGFFFSNKVPGSLGAKC